MPENEDKNGSLVALVVITGVICFTAGIVVGGMIYRGEVQQIQPAVNPSPHATPQTHATPTPSPTNSMPTPTPSEVNTSLKRFLDGKDAVVFYFYGPSCPHCRNVTPYIHEVANSSEFDWVRFYFYNVEKPDQDVYLMANKYRVMAIPTVVIDGLFKDHPVILVGEEQVKDLDKVLRDVRKTMVVEVH